MSGRNATNPARTVTFISNRGGVQSGNALTALAYLRQAVASGRADRGLVDEVRAYLAGGPETADRPFVPRIDL